MPNLACGVSEERSLAAVICFALHVIKAEIKTQINTIKVIKLLQWHF